MACAKLSNSGAIPERRRILLGPFRRRFHSGSASTIFRMGKSRTGKTTTIVLSCLLTLVAMGAAWLCWGQIVFLWRFESLGANAQGFREYRHRKTDIVFVRLPTSSAWVGSSEEQLQEVFEDIDTHGHKNAAGLQSFTRRSESPRHEVALDAFLIAKYEVRQTEWIKATGANPSHFVGENLPVENVSLEDCQALCRKTGLSLPTEAQWEYACRAGSHSHFSFGNTLTRQQANFVDTRPFGFVGLGGQGKRTLPVDAFFAPNAFGLHNMHGNVSEWCADRFNPDFYDLPESRSRNPICKLGKSVSSVNTPGAGLAVTRGGSFSSPARRCRSSSRAWGDSYQRSKFQGFRPVYRLLR